jgi:hypothetical protein
VGTRDVRTQSNRAQPARARAQSARAVPAHVVAARAVPAHVMPARAQSVNFGWMKKGASSWKKWGSVHSYRRTDRQTYWINI